MAQNISLKKSSQSSFTKAMKNVRTLMKKNELKSHGPSSKNATENVKRGVLGRSKQSKQQKRNVKWNQHGKGIVFLSHIPKGFYEEQMHSYFSQFGRVTRLNLVRSEKTGNPKGYAYIEFLYSEVAQVVAETMNNYLMSGKLLKAEYIPGERVSRAMFKNSYIRPDNCPRVKVQKKWIQKVNRNLTSEEEIEEALQEMKRLDKLKNRLEKSGIQLDCQVENGSLTYMEGSQTKPILEIDESDDEVEFKVHPEVKKVVKRKSSKFVISPSGKRLKVETPKSPSTKKLKNDSAKSPSIRILSVQKKKVEKFRSKQQRKSS